MNVPSAVKNSEKKMEPTLTEAERETTEFEKFCREHCLAINRLDDGYLHPDTELAHLVWQAARREERRRCADLVAEMRAEIASKTMPIVHDASTRHWADKLETLCELDEESPNSKEP